MNQTNPTYTFTSKPATTSPELAALDNKRSRMEQLPPAIEECYMVYPDQDTLEFILVLADPGEEGQDAIAGHFPKLKLALDLDQLAVMEEVAKKVPMFTTGRHWFSKPHHFLFVAIKDGTPGAKFLVEAKDVSKALAKAVEAAPGCKFTIVGALEQFEAGGNALIKITQGSAPPPALDLRSEWR